MIISREMKWRRYKSDFLRQNGCTAGEFEAAYVAFMEGKPDTKAYRQFARKYGITIFRDPNIPEAAQVGLSVSIAAIKVMSQTFTESIEAIEEILAGGTKN